MSDQKNKADDNLAGTDNGVPSLGHQTKDNVAETYPGDPADGRDSALKPEAHHALIGLSEEEAQQRGQRLPESDGHNGGALQQVDVHGQKIEQASGNVADGTNPASGSNPTF